ncbi:MAG: penicillin-binding protein 2, partial [Micrococcaceae bacterium]|nr:penicillin-binding protein 2 [Micrococcaceae bacterium]
MARPPARKSKHTEPRRLRTGLALAMVMLVLLGGRLFLVQGLDPSAAAEAATGQRIRETDQQPVRGKILDSSGKILAASFERYDLVVDQRQVKDSFKRKDGDGGRDVVQTEDAVKELAATLDIDQDTLKTSIIGDEGAKKKGYSVVAKGVTPETRNKVLKIGLPWITSQERFEREYPNGTVAGSVLGFLRSSEDGTSQTGAEGLELSQNKALAGEAGTKTFEIAADGVRIPMATLKEKPAVDGQDLKLTINSDIQWAAQEAVMAKQKQFNAEWVNAVVVEVDTGKIRALADSTTVDPADPGATDAKFRRSTTVSQAYEPGSTGKAATFAAALEEGVVKPKDHFTVPNEYTIGKETIHDSMKHETLDMTTAGIFARSYNTGTTMVGSKLSNEQRYEWMKKFGIGQGFDIGVPVNKGIFVPPERWDRRQQYTTMFGQGYSLTSLHTARIFQAIANQGVQIEPSLIESYTDPDGTEHERKEVKSKRVISKKTSKEMRRMMETVVTDGTGYDMDIDGY